MYASRRARLQRHNAPQATDSILSLPAFVIPLIPTKLHLETLLAHAGCEPDPATGAVVSPIHLATTFERAPDGEYPHGYLYSRIDTPNRRQFEQTLARLEGGADGAAFASGMAAAHAVFSALAPGDRVVIPEDVYYGVRKVLADYFAGWGLRYTAVDMTDLDALGRALEPGARLVLAETPSNPMLRITDLQAVAARAHAAGALLVVDATWTPPPIQRPLALGADLVLHSVTKYLGGHSDVLGGAVVAAESGAALFERIRALQGMAGAVMDPFSAWLALRGMRSLGARLRMQCAAAQTLAEFLAAHPRVTAVHYPGLPGHAGHAVARAQMTSFGAMLAFQVDGAQPEAMAVAARARLFTRATSLGGTESLIEHRASVEAPPTRTPANLLRVSVGLEHPDDLLDDLSHALAA